MHITVRELLLLPAMRGAELLAGKAGLERIITSVNFMEVPNIVPYVKRQELLLTTTYPIREDKQAQASLIQDLYRTGVAALAIKPVFYGNTVPEIMVTIAEELNFPLIRLPETASFNEILNPVLEEILDRQAGILRRNEKTHHTLTHIVLGGGSLEEIAQALAEIERSPVSIHSANWRLLAYSKPLAEDEKVAAFAALDTRRLAAATLRRTEPYCMIPGNVAWTTIETDSGPCVLPFYVHPVTVARETFAHLVVWLDPASHSPHDIAALEQASAVVALEVSKLRAVATVEQRFRSYFIEDLIRGRVNSRVDALSRGEAYGWDLSATFTPIMLEIDNFSRFYRASATSPAQILRRLWNAVSVATTVYAPDCVAVDRGTRILLLLPRAPQGFAKMINEELADAEKLSASFGVGRTMNNILDLRTAVEQATAALEIGQLINGPGSVTRFDDLGLYRVLFGNIGPEVQQFADDILSPLYASDKSSNTELLRTLEAILRCHGRLKDAAKELFLHYNTLRYRATRIEELTKLDLRTTQGMVNLQVALMIKRMALSNRASDGKEPE